MNFYQMCDKINGGEPYKGGDGPINAIFHDYIKYITNGSKVMTADQGNWDFIPITDEDTARYGAVDVLKNQETMAHYEKLNQRRQEEYLKRQPGGGKVKFFNPTVNLGPPMSDEEYRKFMGITW